MATFSVPQHQPSHHHPHFQPLSQHPFSNLQQPTSIGIGSYNVDQPSPTLVAVITNSLKAATSNSPHLRHGHRHHPQNNSVVGGENSPFSLKHLERSINNSHNQLSLYSSGMDPAYSGTNFSDSISPSLSPKTFSSTFFNNSTTTLTSPFRNNGSETQQNLTNLFLQSAGSPFSLNVSVSDADSIYDNATELGNNSFSFHNATSSNVATATSGPTFLPSLYTIVVPVMIFFCILTCVVNLIIVLSARWCRKPMSPTLYYSISLALADAYASFILAVGLTINSILPVVYKIEVTKCLTLTIEAFRSGGVLVTVCHLLALGVNHWIGIARPLHYAATMTRRTAWIVIILSWICPIIMLFIYYSSISGEGFLSADCGVNDFLRKQTYRVFFASCFFAPLFLLSLIYIHIFLIVRSHQTNRLRYQVKKKSCQTLRKNVKAALTTVLILGTYILGWMPATLFGIIACDDCIYKLKDVDSKVRYAIGISVNVLVILKTFADPIIYALRYSDIQLSLRKMKYDFLQLFCKACVHSVPPPENDRGFSKFNRSLYDTKSIRMSSFASSSSSRRTATAAAANLINASPGSQNNHRGHQGGGGFNNSYKNHNGNGNGSPNPHHGSPHVNVKSQLLYNKKTAFETTEMR